jgi:hypothetical protein
MQYAAPYHYRDQSVSGASAAPLLKVAFVPHIIASLSRTKMMKEGEKCEPNLHRLVACGNMLVAITAWIHQDLQRRVLERVGADLGSGIDVEASDAEVEIRWMEEISAEVEAQAYSQNVHSVSRALPKSQCTSVLEMTEGDEAGAMEMRLYASKFREAFETAQSIKALVKLGAGAGGVPVERAGSGGEWTSDDDGEYEEDDDEDSDVTYSEDDNNRERNGDSEWCRYRYQ